MDTIEIIALTLGAGWASGINLYAAVMMLGLMGMTGNMDLPESLQLIENPMVIGVAAIMFFIEFLVDKVPGVDTVWDSIHTFIRIPAGAILAAGAVGEVSASTEFAAFLAGGSLAATSHTVKAGSRAMINTSPEPMSNWIASISEDFIAVGGLWAALHYPIAFIIFLILFILFSIWLIPKLWRGIKRVYSYLGRLFGRETQEPRHSLEEATLPSAEKSTGKNLE